MIKKYYLKYKEIINYLIIGGLTTLVSLAIYYVLSFLVLNPNNPIELQIINIISWICAVIFAYFTNRKYVFASKNKCKKELVDFFVSRVLTLILDMIIMYIFVTKMHLSDKIIKIISQMIVIIVNYILSKCFVFKKK